MSKLLMLLTLLIFFASCTPPADNCTQSAPSLDKQVASTGTCPAPVDPTVPPVDPTIHPEPDPIPEPGSDVPAAAFSFKTNIQFDNFAAADIVKVNKAIAIIKKVIASSEFRDRVLNFTYNGKKQFVDNGGLTNAQIYQSLLDGKEDLLPVVDNEMDLELVLYYSWTSTVGYTTYDDLMVHMNTKFFSGYTPSEVADNIFHEWTHKLGYDHAASYSVSRDSSVPYGLGYLMEELGKKYE